MPADLTPREALREIERLIINPMSACHCSLCVIGRILSRVTPEAEPTGKLDEETERAFRLLNAGMNLLNDSASVVALALIRKKLEEAILDCNGLRAMISCEKVERDCAGTHPDPSSVRLSRCLMHQLEVAKYGFDK